MTYSWHRVSGSVPSRSQGQNSNELTIPKAIPPDEGMYYCIAVKDGVRVETNRTILKVDGKSMCLLYDGGSAYITRASYLLETNKGYILAYS